jgi:N-acetylmuramic acid 6-phosphate (MurNAc-6-P) etherase
VLRPLAWLPSLAFDGATISVAAISSSLVGIVDHVAIAPTFGFHHTTTRRQHVHAGGTWNRYAATRKASGP